MVLSVIFSYEVRKIQVKGLIDSRMITFSVYIVVITAIIVPVVVLLSSLPNVRYGILGAVCLVASTLLLCLNFIPKVSIESDCTNSRDHVLLAYMRCYMYVQTKCVSIFVCQIECVNKYELFLNPCTELAICVNQAPEYITSFIMYM